MPLPNPVIVIPGITGNYLRDEYALPPEIVWSVLTAGYERASLHPDNPRYEAIEPARVMPDQLFEIAYRELIEELRHNLRESETRPVPVYPFAYDWRQDMDRTEEQLADFIDEVIERTRLLRHYNDDGYAARAKVNLVGHSMGGLLIAGVLKRRGAEARIGKVATLATPFRGSFEAVIKILTGTAGLGTTPPSSREREAARMTPALYQLFPSFPGGLQVPPGLEPSIFNPAIWQPSVVETIREYVFKYGLNPAAAAVQAPQIFATLLQRARDHRLRIENLDLAQAGLSTTDWLCVVGVDSETRVRLRVTMQNGAPAFDLASRDRENGWKNDDPARQALTGDGTVPFDGARPGFLDLETLVCVAPDDFGYWELADRTLARTAGFHGILPNMNLLHRLIVIHFTGRPVKYGNVWGRRPPGVTDWAPPIAGLPYV